MVKGISKQVIVVHGAEPAIFEEAIFILKEEAIRDGGVSDEALMEEARALLSKGRRSPPLRQRLMWVLVGAAATGAFWLLSFLL